jgi:hypothetical protein
MRRIIIFVLFLLTTFGGVAAADRDRVRDSGATLRLVDSGRHYEHRPRYGHGQRYYGGHRYYGSRYYDHGRRYIYRPAYRHYYSYPRYVRPYAPAYPYAAGRWIWNGYQWIWQPSYYGPNVSVYGQFSW